MARHGRCRCGVILEFQRGPDGYKTRCPKCRSVVRLRVGAKPAEVAAKLVTCSCGAAVPDTGASALVCPHCKRQLKGAPSSPPAPPVPVQEYKAPGPAAPAFEPIPGLEPLPESPLELDLRPGDDLPIAPDAEEPVGEPFDFGGSTVACTTCQTQISSRLLECPACGAPQFPTDLGGLRF
jgi:hypothetical protein